MKRFLLSTAALSALLFTARAASAQTAAESGKPQKLVKVATIQGADAVRQFEHNVQVLQAERQNALALDQELKAEKNEKKKRALETKFNEAMTKLRQDNVTMAKTYGFSLTRNYTMEIDSASIYMAVTDAEAAQVEKANAAKK